ncbi:hypothetical protein [Novosphingobium aquimarinum]|uniref:hypothetical protein n=1 Tax=Novosphingobium aquimarinum TaxID=2682494 RepID=UPI0012EC8F9A|nr:hypothetical protein [Novosphingobium aquimarinum]
MADFTITIYVEGFHTPRDGGGHWLGRTLSVALTQAPARRFTDVEKSLLKALLCPWRWDEIDWTTPGTPHRLNVTGPTDALEAYVERLIALRETLPAGQEDPLVFRNVAAPDEAEEGVPIWPGLLVQLSRSGPELSHGLNLAHLAELSAIAPQALAIDAIVVGGTRYSTNGSGSFEVRWQPGELFTLPPTGHTGLIDHATRMVVHGDPIDEQATASWLAELPARLGRAIDPLARLADLVELLGDAAVHEPRPAIERMLLHLFGGSANGYDPDRLADVFLAIADLTPGDDIAAERQFARDWSIAFGQRRLAMIDDLVAAIPHATPLDPAALRSAAAAADFRQIMQDGLRTAVPALPLECRKTVLDWLSDDGNIGTFLSSLVLEALARAYFLQTLIARVGGEAGDWCALHDAFDYAFAAALEMLGMRYHPDVMRHVRETVFHIERDSIDAAARDGLPFRVDTIFHDPVQNGQGQPDVHLMMDGFLVAVREATQDSWSDFALVSGGSVDIVHDRGRAALPDETAAIGTRTPLPVVFDVAHSTRRASATESRVAVASYHGEPMISWSRRAADDSEAEPAPIEILYGAGDTRCPPLAYGQTFEIACGYQAPGGLLPHHFCDPAAPLAFSATVLANCPVRFRLKLPLRRTLLPGAPRLLATGPTEGRLSLTGPKDADVRPLWREHVARWPSELVAEREALHDAPTLYLDEAYADTLAHRDFTFTVRPPALGLGKAREDATTALVWRYWMQRDQWWTTGNTTPVAHPTDTDAADDPAVVGLLHGQHAGRGGVYFRLHGIEQDGPTHDLVAPVPAALAEGQRVDVTVIATESQLAMDYAEPDADGVGRLTVRIPRDKRCVLETRTLCDGRFFPGGDDERFATSAYQRGTERGGDLLFGSARIAIESLPETNHLPSPAALWRQLEMREDVDRGDVVAAFAAPAAEDPDHVRRADFIGSLEPVWQTWRWDGGPVFAYTSAAGGGLQPDTLEPAGDSRARGYVTFERLMFEDRRDAGSTATVLRSAGTEAMLFTRESPSNRGANYLRLRLVAISRYAALRPGSPDTAREAGMASDAHNISPWRGYTIGTRRADPLPTPRVALAAPLFDGVAGQDGTAGGFGVYLDHPMYDTRHGGGLDEALEVEVTIERLDHGLQEGDRETAALAIGADPILEPGDGDPFEQGAQHDRIFRLSSEGVWEPREPERKRLRTNTVLGQTLEPRSPAPSFPFSIAFVEASLDGAILRPNTMARVEARVVAGGLASPWSAPVWVQFLPDMRDAAIAGQRRVPLFRAARVGQRLWIEPNAEAGALAAERMARLVRVSGDAPPVDATPGPYLVSGIAGVLLRSIPDAAGLRRTRVAAVVPAIAEGERLRLVVPDGLEPSHVRVIELQHVTQPHMRSEDASLTSATQRWFGDQAERHAFDEGPVASVDINERVVAVGPLIAIE